MRFSIAPCTRRHQFAPFPQALEGSGDATEGETQIGAATAIPPTAMATMTPLVAAPLQLRHPPPRPVPQPCLPLPPPRLAPHPDASAAYRQW